MAKKNNGRRYCFGLFYDPEDRACKFCPERLSCMQEAGSGRNEDPTVKLILDLLESQQKTLSEFRKVLRQFQALRGELEALTIVLSGVARRLNDE